MVNIFNTVATSNALTRLSTPVARGETLRVSKEIEAQYYAELLLLLEWSAIVFDKYSNVRLFTSPKFPFALSPTSPYIVHQ